MKKTWFLPDCRRLFYCEGKIFKIMRLSVFFIVLASLQTFALSNYAQTKKLELKIKKTPIVEVLSEIEDESDFFFFYNNKAFLLDKEVTLDLKDKTINEVLDVLFKDTDIQYTISDRQIILSAKSSSTILLEQQQKISGKVTDILGEPLPGVTIVIEGTTNGTITDFDGNFILLNVPSNATLIFSFVGMRSLEIAVAGKITFNVVMEEDAIGIEEVIAVGYGVQKKSVVTAAIGKVKGEDLQMETPTRVEDVLKGRISGVTITQGSGQPGASSQIRIRGVGTTGDSNPLFIVDGMMVNDGIDYLNPSDISSVEVLKDAASAAVYGTRGANGVILITTKSGSDGPTKITYDFSQGWQNPWKKRDLLNAQEYVTLVNEGSINGGYEEIYPGLQNVGKGTNWQDEVFNSNAPITNHQIGLSGGTEKARYFISLGYLSQEGIVGGNYDRSNFERWSVRSNSTYKVFDKKDDHAFLNKFSIGVNASFSNRKTTGVDVNSEYGTPLGSALMLSPLLPVYAEDPETTLNLYPNAVKDAEGRVFTVPGTNYNEITNPLAAMTLPGEASNSNKFLATVWGELELYHGLKFKSSYGLDAGFWGTDGWTPVYYLGMSNYKDQSEVWSSMNRSYIWQLENTLTYTTNVQDKHNFTVLLGQSASEYGGRALYGKGFDLQAENPGKANIDFTMVPNPNREATGGALNSYAIASYFGRLSYNYMERYMFEGTVRRDGSSRFGTNNRFAVFPSVSAGWNLTNEKFMDDRPAWFDSFKLRASWGKNGNDAIGDFKYTVTMSGNNNYLLGNGESEEITYGVKPSGIPNPSLRWEETAQTNIGIDTRFFNNSLTFTFDWYQKNTNGMLIQVPIPSYVGDSKPTGNVGEMRNSGIEFDLSYRFSISDLNINLSANAAYLKNELINLGNESGFTNYDTFQNVGTISRGENSFPFPFFYGRKTDGLFQSQEEVDSYINAEGAKLQPNAAPGDVRFLDISQDGIINDDDRTMIGKGMPDWNYSFSLNMDYKGFDLSAFFQGVQGNDIFDATRRIGLSYINLPAFMLDRWTGAGTSNTVPRMNFNDKNDNWISSDLFIQNGSFLRLKSVQLGYSLPKQLLNRISIERMRLFILGENLLTFTSYRGFDPEISSGGTSLGIDRGVYPQPRTISVGVNVTL